jgi:hypothetical protein
VFLSHCIKIETGIEYQTYRPDDSIHCCASWQDRAMHCIVSCDEQGSVQMNQYEYQTSRDSQTRWIEGDLVTKESEIGAGSEETKVPNGDQEAAPSEMQSFVRRTALAGLKDSRWGRFCHCH